ncbi:hypothetical protein [Streptomyces sp. NPDC005385]
MLSLDWELGRLRAATEIGQALLLLVNISNRLPPHVTPKVLYKCGPFS